MFSAVQPLVGVRSPLRCRITEQQEGVKATADKKKDESSQNGCDSLGLEKLMFETGEERNWWICIKGHVCVCLFCG